MSRTKQPASKKKPSARKAKPSETQPFELLNVRLDAITVDEGFQLRDLKGGTLQEAVEDYAEAYKAGKELPPLRVQRKGDSLRLVSGFHRYYAARAAGLEEVPCEVYDCTDKQALFLAASSNAGHGIRFSRQDSKKALKVMFEAYPGLINESPRKFQAETGIHEATFRKFRDALKAAQGDLSAVSGGEPAGGTEPPDEGGDDGEGGGEGGEGEPGSGTPANEEPGTYEEPPHISVHRKRCPALKDASKDDIEQLLRNEAVFTTLQGPRLQAFCNEYFHRRHCSAAIEDLKIADEEHPVKGQIKPLISAIIYGLVNLKTWLEFLICPDCGGNGCEKCHKRGFR